MALIISAYQCHYVGYVCVGFLKWILWQLLRKCALAEHHKLMLAEIVQLVALRTILLHQVDLFQCFGKLACCWYVSRCARGLSVWPGLGFSSLLWVRFLWTGLATISWFVFVYPSIEYETIECDDLFTYWYFSEAWTYLGIESVSIHVEVGGCISQPQYSRK